MLLNSYFGGIFGLDVQSQTISEAVTPLAAELDTGDVEFGPFALFVPLVENP